MSNDHGGMDRLVHDANQIARFFSTYPREEALAGVADHIRKFWERRMREKIIHHVAEGGAGMDELAVAAVKQLPPVKA
jgi:formate dehydrogenase subunit delta